MPIHLAESVLGIFAFDGEGKMVASEKFPRDQIAVAEIISSIQMGTPTKEHRDLIEKLLKEGHIDFTLESKLLAEKLGEEFNQANFKYLLPNPAGSKVREKLRDIAKDIVFNDVDTFARDVNFIIARHKLRMEAAQRDSLIIHSIGMLDDIDKMTNILVGRVREWYSVHFPELDRLIQDHEVYVKLLISLGNREKFTKEAIMDADISEEEADKISEAKSDTLGATLDEVDISLLQKIAKKILGLCDLRKEVSSYIEGLMAQVAPNMRSVAGGSIGARLISLAGGLKSLSRMPASTIQVMGAEKALFRALKKKGRPPKHGVIFQYPDVKGTPKKLRGKIARALAGKIAIAARVDAMSGEFVGDKLVNELKVRIANIKIKEKR